MVKQYYRDYVSNNFLYVLRHSYNILDKEIRKQEQINDEGLFPAWALQKNP